MKKLFLSFGLLMGCALCTPNIMFAIETPQVCDMSRPCAYTGTAWAGTSSIKIQVYYSKSDDNFVAIINGDASKVAYVLYDSNEGKWYVNYNSNKYYFKM